ncbi:MAG TPA: LmeA family phospholipid-binding protein [Armatimonadota bacterium]|nr:LmeA family phospholipid-binding protein [Armatimonadota bacterium]
MESHSRTEIVLPLRVGTDTDNQSIAAAIAAAMERDLPPGAAARVAVDGPPGGLGTGDGASITLCISGVEASAMPLPRLAPRGQSGMEGRLSLLRLRLEDVRLPEGALDLVEMSFPGAGYWLGADGDRTHLRLVNLPGGTARVLLSTASLRRLVSARAPTIANPEIRLADGGWVEATGGIRLGPFPARARLRGRIVCRTGNALCIEDLELSAGSLALPAPLVRSVETAVNPLVDLARDVPLPFDVRITQVTTEDGNLRLDARVSPLVADGAKKDWWQLS